MEFPESAGTITLHDYDLQCFVPYHIFCEGNEGPDTEAMMYCATVSLQDNTQTRPWKELKSIVDRVHRYVCGHSSYTDMKILMERNGIWT